MDLNRRKFFKIGLALAGGSLFASATGLQVINLGKDIEVAKDKV
jgi:hypothetical protein